MPKFLKHIFICTNQREPGNPRGCCDPTGEKPLFKAFKKIVAEHGLHARVRANKAGCLDQCEHGPTVVVYPDEVWYGFVDVSDVNEIVESHIRDGKPVERLRLPETCLNAARCPHKTADRQS